MEEMCYDIFISYSRNDFDTYSVDKLLESLKNRGFKVWLDQEEVDPGAEFMARIFNAIESSTVLVFLSSEQSNQSPYVQLEILYAQAKGKAILPIVLDDSDFNSSLLGFLNSKNFSKWDGRNWTRCVNDIASVLLKNLDADVLYNKAVALRDNNLDQYLDYLEKAARKGHVRSQIELGWHYAGSNQYDAERWLRAAAESEDPQGKLELGRYYLETGNPEGKEKAVSLFKEAANAGSDEARVFLGDYYFREGEALFRRGEGSQADNMCGQAYEWYEKAKALSHIARLSLTLLFEGRDLFYDGPRTSVEWFVRLWELAEQDNAEALFMIGRLFENGWEASTAEFVECGDPLGGKGSHCLPLIDNPDNINGFSTIFDLETIIDSTLSGPVTVARAKRNFEEAGKYYLKSAKKGNILAMIRLAEDYYLFSSFKTPGPYFGEATGLSKDDAEWCAKEAEKNGYCYARALISRDPDVIDQAIAFWDHPERSPFSWEVSHRKSRMLELRSHQLSILPQVDQLMKHQYDLASLSYDNSEYNSAIDYLKRTAVRGWGPSQWALAVSADDPEESFRWLYIYVTTRPVVGAKFSYLLSKYYEEGIGTSRDMKRSLFWLRQSAKRGYYYAKKELSQRYREGRGVPRDDNTADKIERIQHPFADLDKQFSAAWNRYRMCKEEDLVSGQISELEIMSDKQAEPLRNLLFDRLLLYKEGIPISQDVSAMNSGYYAQFVSIIKFLVKASGDDFLKVFNDDGQVEPMFNSFTHLLDVKIHEFTGSEDWIFLYNEAW